MLSFLREQGLRGASSQEPSTEAANTAQETQQQYLTVAAQDKNVRRTTFMLAALFVTGLLSLLVMIKKTAPQTAVASAADSKQAQIEVAIARLTGIRSEMFSKIDQIVDKFYEFSEIKQLRVDELIKNPFKHELFLSNADRFPAKRYSNIDPALLRRQQLKNKAESMQLFSIMKTGRGDASRCCMIDDKILYVGDTIKGFTVSQISDKFVKLQYRPRSNTEDFGTLSDGLEIILKLSE